MLAPFSSTCTNFKGSFIMTFKNDSTFLFETRQTSPQLISSSSLFLLSSSFDIFLIYFFFLSRSFFFLFLFNNDMNMCVTHDSHKHFEIYELRPHINRCIITCCAEIYFGSHHIFSGERKVLVKLTTIYSAYSTVA